MNLVQENIDELNARVLIKINPEDYQQDVSKVLEDYRKKMTLQGFRPGKVPYSVAKKMFGKSVLAEQLNKMLSSNLDKHIKENNLQLLGQPLPAEDEKIDIELDHDFEFKFDMGMAPQFSVDLSKEKFNRYKIAIDDELIKKYVVDFQRRFGKSEDVEAVSEKDMIYGSLHELDKENKHKENGIHNHTTIVVEYVENKDAKSKLIGRKVGDVITVEPSKLCKGQSDLSAMLGIPVSELDGAGKFFDLKIESIHNIDPHPLNQELFDRVLGPNVASNEEEFRAKIAADLEKYLNRDSDMKLMRDIQEKLLERLKLPLPDNFLKRWLVVSNAEGENKITSEDIEKNYDDYSRHIRLQLIEGKILKENKIQVEFVEIEERVKSGIREKFAAYGSSEIPDDLINQFAGRTLQNQDEVRKIYEQMVDEKLIAFFKETLKLAEKEVSFDEFVKLASAKPGKGGLMNQISNLLKF